MSDTHEAEAGVRGGGGGGGEEKARKQVGGSETVRYGTRWHGMYGKYQGMGYGVLFIYKIRGTVLDCMVWHGIGWERVGRDGMGWEKAGRDGMGRERGASSDEEVNCCCARSEGAIIEGVFVPSVPSVGSTPLKKI